MVRRLPFFYISAQGGNVKICRLTPDLQAGIAGAAKNFECDNKDPNLGCDPGIDVAG